jgi:hypothetical protein
MIYDYENHIKKYGIRNTSLYNGLGNLDTETIATSPGVY